MSSHASVRELLPLYVLGILDGTPDCEIVCNHLASGCLGCTRELGEYASLAAKVGETIAPATLPDALRAKVEKRIAESKREEPAPIAKVLAFPTRERWLLVAAASVAAMAILSAFYFQDSLRRERLDSFDANKRLVEVESRDRHLEEELAADRDVLASLAGNSKVFDLAPASKDQQGSARVVWDRTNRRWIVLAKDLKPLPAGKAYELWFIAGNEKIPAGTFRPDASGSARHIVAVPEGLQRIDVGAVTLEPAAGVSAPTGPIVIAGKVG